MNKAPVPNSFANPLVVDASSTPVQVGIAGEEQWLRLESVELPALEGLFRATSLLLEKTGRKLREVDALFFCQGPGSTLGLRISAAFVKTVLWERRGKIPLYSYNALDLAARMAESPPLHLQAPFRKGWRFVRHQDGDAPVGKKEIRPAEEAFSLFSDSHHLPDPRKAGSSIEPSRLLSYDLTRTKGLLDLAPVASPAESPEVYSPSPPSFRKWKPALAPSSEKARSS